MAFNNPDDKKRTVTLQSNRIYLSTLSAEDRNAILTDMVEFNRLKEWLYNQCYNAAFLCHGTEAEPDSRAIHKKAWDLFGHDISGYTITSLFPVVYGLISAQKELRNLYRQDQKNRISNRAAKIAKTKSELKDELKLKSALVQFHRKHKCYPSADQITMPKRLKRRYPLHEIVDKKGSCAPKDPSEFQKEAYLFECWLDKQIRRNKAKLPAIEDKQNRDKAKSYDIPRRITFGSLRHYRFKDTKTMTTQQRKQWKRERDFRRSCHMQISGRRTSVYGNFLCRYNPESKQLDLSLQSDKGRILHIKNLEFPYRGDLLKDNFKAAAGDRTSVGYTIDLKYDGHGKPYLIVKAAISIKRYMCPFNPKNGVLAVDLNWDHIAWCELNKIGCPVNHGVIDLPITGKTTNQNRDTIGRAVAEVIGLCKKSGKPLVMEQLDFVKKKSQMEYSSRTGNRKLSAFAYQHMTQGLINRAEDNGVSVERINPAYTSFIGKVKYMRHMACSVHIAAAYVIGRKGMKMKERIPSYLQNAKGRSKKAHTAWGRLYSVCKGMYHPKYFYEKLPDFKTQKELITYVKEQVG